LAIPGEAIGAIINAPYTLLEQVVAKAANKSLSIYFEDALGK